MESGTTVLGKEHRMCFLNESSFQSGWVSRLLSKDAIETYKAADLGW